MASLRTPSPHYCKRLPQRRMTCTRNANAAGWTPFRDFCILRTGTRSNVFWRGTGMKKMMMIPLSPISSENSFPSFSHSLPSVNEIQTQFVRDWSIFRILVLLSMYYIPTYFWILSFENHYKKLYFRFELLLVRIIFFFLSLKRKWKRDRWEVELLDFSVTSPSPFYEESEAKGLFESVVAF